MSGKAIANVDDFGVSIPLPNEPFTATVIHPRNLAIQERQETARKLSRSEYREAIKDVKSLRASLVESNYYELLGEYKALKQRHKLYTQELELATTEEDKIEQGRLLEIVRVKGLATFQSLERLRSVAVQYETRLLELKTHDQEVEREKAHRKLNLLMKEEAGKWKDLLVKHWARLGFSYVTTDKNMRRIVNLVDFERCVISPDVVWFKVAISQKTFFGHKSLLPQGVRVRDLIDDKTLMELSYACQRQITAESNYASGVWILVHRLGTTDGLIEYVSLEQVLQYYPYESRHLMPVPLGVGERREIKWLMLAEHPHFLVGGSTGNGKSNFTHAMICSLIRFQTPEDLRLVFIDLKAGVEFKVYEGIPHLLMPVISRVEDAVNTLAQMEALRSERMKQLADANCTDILEYNEKFPDHKMARVVIFVDEYARLKARGKEFEAIADQAVGEITALGRAAGVHLFAATQTPYARILPGEAKNNMTVRIAFAMRTLAASQSILDTGEARKLPMEIKGRALGAVGSVAFEFQTPHTDHEFRIESAKLASGYGEGEGEQIQLPEVVKLDVFDEHELLDISINELGGSLGVQAIFDFVKDSGQLSRSQVREMVKKIRERKEIEFEGECYGMKQRGNTVYLIKKAAPQIAKTPTLSPLPKEPEANQLPDESVSYENPTDDQIPSEFHGLDSGQLGSSIEADPEPIEEITAVALEQVELES